jgi:hypothetical protein
MIGKTMDASLAQHLILIGILDDQRVFPGLWFAGSNIWTMPHHFGSVNGFMEIKNMLSMSRY